jgi:hypothetical protein
MCAKEEDEEVKESTQGVKCSWGMKARSTTAKRHIKCQDFFRQNKFYFLN